MSRKYLWIIAFTSCLAASQVTFADDSLCREGLGKMVQSLNLDDAQKAKVKPIIDQLKTNMKSYGSQMDGLEDQMTAQTNSANMDQNKVSSLVDQKTKLIGDMMKARMSATNQIYGVLNADQKSKLQDKIKKEDHKMASAFKNCANDD